MAEAKPHKPVLRFAAVFSRHLPAIEWACQTASRQWGPIEMASPDFSFEQTGYYQSTMGSDLIKRLVAFRDLIDAPELVESKLQSNQWERQLKQTGQYPESRPINIDPGYLTEAKVVLATMKDRDHRLYLDRGVFGEVTLFYQLPGRWAHSRWTYPDFQSADYHDFFSRARQFLRDCLQTRGD